MHTGTIKASFRLIGDLQGGMCHLAELPMPPQCPWVKRASSAIAQESNAQE